MIIKGLVQGTVIDGFWDRINVKYWVADTKSMFNTGLSMT